MNAILILDNCSAHKIDISKILLKITIKFLPPNVTSCHQPADMEMIAALKTGYKSLYLCQLLEMFDIHGGYEQGAVSRRRQKQGQKGIQYGGLYDHDEADLEWRRCKVFVVAGGKLIFYLLPGTLTLTTKLDMHQHQSGRKLLARIPAMSYVI